MVYKLKPLSPADTESKAGGSAILVWGPTGVGKTYFIVNSTDVAEPLYLCNFDRSADHLLKHYKGKEYYYEKFVPTDKASAIRQLDTVKAMVRAAIARGVGVFGFDNVAALWAIVCKAYLPDTGKPLPRDYGDANDWMRELCLELEESQLFTIFSAPASEMWLGAQTNSGLYVPDTWKHLGFHVTSEIYLFSEGGLVGVPPVPREQSLLGKYKAMIVTAKLQPLNQGVILEDPTLGELWPLLR